MADSKLAWVMKAVLGHVFGISATKQLEISWCNQLQFLRAYIDIKQHSQVEIKIYFDRCSNEVGKCIVNHNYRDTQPSLQNNVSGSMDVNDRKFANDCTMPWIFSEIVHTFSFFFTCPLAKTCRKAVWCKKSKAWIRCFLQGSPRRIGWKLPRWSRRVFEAWVSNPPRRASNPLLRPHRWVFSVFFSEKRCLFLALLCCWTLKCMAMKLWWFHVGDL